MTSNNASTGRELSDQAVRSIAEALVAYIRKRGSRGLSFALDARGLAPLDRAAVVAAVHHLEEARS